MFTENETFSSFSVDDIKKAKDFYGSVLGLKVSERMGLLDVEPANGGHVMIYPKSDHKPATFTVLNIQVSDIDKAVTYLVGKKVKFEIYDDPNMKTDKRGIMTDEQMKMKIAWFNDPADNILAIIEGSM